MKRSGLSLRRCTAWNRLRISSELSISWYLIISCAWETLKVFIDIFSSAKEVMFLSLSVCLSVCLLATLCKNFWTDFHELFGEGWQWASEQMIKFWWWYRSGIWIWICIVRLVRRALVEVCTVPVLLVYYDLLRSLWWPAFLAHRVAAWCDGWLSWHTV